MILRQHRCGSVVTGIVAEYEESRKVTDIDRIEVSGSMTEKDLLWIVGVSIPRPINGVSSTP